MDWRACAMKAWAEAMRARESLINWRLRWNSTRLTVHYAQTAWEQAFLAQWPAGSEAHTSYWARLQQGPSYTVGEAVPAVAWTRGSARGDKCTTGGVSAQHSAVPGRACDTLMPLFAVCVTRGHGRSAVPRAIPPQGPAGACTQQPTVSPARKLAAGPYRGPL
jgi:hypothetical protein